MPPKPTTSSHRISDPNAVAATSRTAPALSACRCEPSTAIWTAMMPIRMYSRPRAARPARASADISELFAARRPADRTPTDLRRAERATIVTSCG